MLDTWNIPFHSSSWIATKLLGRRLGDHFSLSNAQWERNLYVYFEVSFDYWKCVNLLNIFTKLLWQWYNYRTDARTQALRYCWSQSNGHIRCWWSFIKLIWRSITTVTCDTCHMENTQHFWIIFYLLIFFLFK